MVSCPGRGYYLVATVPHPEPEPTAWTAFLALISQANIVHFSALTDIGPFPSALDGEYTIYSVTVYPAVGKPKTFVRESICDAILAALGIEPVKLCSKCGESKPVGMFSRNIDIPDGRCPCCRDCDRARQKKWKAKRKELKLLALAKQVPPLPAPGQTQSSARAKSDRRKPRS